MPVIEWFAYFGPNRRSDKKVVEITLKFGPGDQHGFPQQSSEIKDLLLEGGVLAAEDIFPEQALPDERKAWYSSLLLQTALLFQQKAGHRVSFTSLSVCPEQNRCIALMEYDHADVGMTAVKLAVELLTGKRRLLAEPFRLFGEFASQRRLPADAEAIMEAARRRDIPCIQLEQSPYKREDFKDLTGGACIRKNGLLMLGHGVHQKVLDGTFLLNETGFLKDMLDDVNQRRELLERLNIPVLLSGQNGANGVKKCHLIAVNGKLTAIAGSPACPEFSVKEAHSTLIEYALDVNRAVGFAPVALVVLTADLSKPFTRPGEGVLDFELAPQLDRYLAGQQDEPSIRMQSTADELANWLFPDKSATRMPIIAVTGTNGKTTTTRMINHVLNYVGRKPGLVCTDGVFLNGKELEKGDECSDVGHFKVLTSREVDMAVLETHHAGIMSRGFAFQWCDVAVCLNVTEDHLGVGNVDTVEQMAAVKQALPERARYAAVLNADDPYCQAMLEAVTARKVCLVSTVLSRAKLFERVAGRNACFCVLEQIEGEEWVVIHDQGQRIPVTSVRLIPATFDGKARFNVSNAMHAIVACYLAGIETELLGPAMGHFKSSYETTPGRMNVFEGLPFRVIMDFAHNPDGFRSVAEFVDRQELSGRKLVVFAGSGDRTDETLKKMSRELAGHFDFYFCKEHLRLDGPHLRKQRFVAKIMREGLLEAGVPESQTSLLVHGKEVFFRIFDTCQPGDLLILLLGHVEKHLLPDYIKEYTRLET